MMKPLSLISLYILGLLVMATETLQHELTFHGVQATCQFRKKAKILHCHILCINVECQTNDGWIPFSLARICTPSILQLGMEQCLEVRAMRNNFLQYNCHVCHILCTQRNATAVISLNNVS